MGLACGSLVNSLYSGMKNCPEPEVGMGCSILMWSDRHPASIVSVEKLAKGRYDMAIKIVRDNYKVVSGSMASGSAEYEFSPGDGSPSLYKRRRADGKFVACYINPESGRLVAEKNGNGLMIGRRDKYEDPHF